MSIISFAIPKGGTGKTTSVINIAAALREQGKKILLVDADPQANLTQALGITKETAYNLFTELKKETEGKKAKDEKPAVENIGKGLDLIPSSSELAGAEVELVNVYGREHLLTWILKPLENSYDFIFIDCPSSINMLTINALMASRYVLMPLQAEYLPLKGVESFKDHLENIKKIKEKLGQEIEVLGFILTKFDEHKKMNCDVRRKLEEEFPGKVFQSHIRTNIQLAKAQEAGLDIFSFDKHAHNATDYMALSKEFLSKIE